MSPPSRRRGLKYMVGRFIMMWLEVASLAEAWIEIVKKVLQKSVARGRLPRGGVD